MERAAERVTITDVTLREYGQNVPASHLHVFTPEIRSKIASRLIQAGFTDIEVFSCVQPNVAPAMHRSALERIARQLGRVDGVNLVTLVPNKCGYENFLDMGLGPTGFNHTMGLFFSAVEAHHIANMGRPLEDSIDECRSIIRDAVAKNIRVVGYISAAFGYIGSEKGKVMKPNPKILNDYVDLYLDLGVEAVTLSDLQGVADEKETGEVLESILEGRKGKDSKRLGYHPHHADGKKAIANSKVALDLGIRRFDASLGGTGGCVTGAPGNQPTEGLVHFLSQQGFETGVNESEVISLAEMVQKNLYSRVSAAKIHG